MTETYAADTFNLTVTVILIILNAFFVAAEFALVKVNKSKIKHMQKENRPFAGVAMWLYKRQSMALSACQMGITIASLALGWIGEPALAHLLHPLLLALNITSEAVLHGIAFGIAFTIITSLHIVLGEQFPKIYAIRRPIITLSWLSAPLKVFYIMFYPLMWVLDSVTSKLLRMVGIESDGDHDSVLTEEEIRASLSIAYSQGDLSEQEHQLLDAAFKFDDQVARQLILPRAEVAYFDLNLSYEENLKLVKKTKHTRFPLCEGSLDHIKGVIHIKDLIGEDNPDLKKLAREPMFVPETLAMNQLLQWFRKTKQHLAFVEDEYGTMIGIVTLENVLEQLVGQVQDEFDVELPEIVQEADGKYLIDGDQTLVQINDKLNIGLQSQSADTLSGLLTEESSGVLTKGQKISLSNGIEVEIVALKDRRAEKVRLTLPQ